LGGGAREVWPQPVARCESGAELQVCAGPPGAALSHVESATAEGRVWRPAAGVDARPTTN
jgi:hypothetical protein